MATPGENVSTLIRYWQDAVNVPAWERQMLGATDWPSRLYSAARAMSELLDTIEGKAAFAQGSVFETCLALEAAGVTDAVLATPRGKMVVSRPPRLTMLDRLYTITTGGWWAPPTPDGVTGWLRSTTVSAGAIASTILGDPRVDVRASACKLVQDVAMPRFWAEFFSQQRTFPALEEQLKTSPWNVMQRATLASLATGAGARVQAELARYAAAALPSFMTGDGAATPTLPARGKPWYRDARILFAGAIGLVGGIAAGNTR